MTESLKDNLGNKIVDKKFEKIRLVELAVLSSRLNKQYRDLGEYIFNTFKKNKTLNSHSLKFERYFRNIKELLFEIKKLEK